MLTVKYINTAAKKWSILYMYTLQNTKIILVRVESQDTSDAIITLAEAKKFTSTYS